jgi:hypothetical protein
MQLKLCDTYKIENRQSLRFLKSVLYFFAFVSHKKDNILPFLCRIFKFSIGKLFASLNVPNVVLLALDSVVSMYTRSLTAYMTTAPRRHRTPDTGGRG